MKKLFLFAVLGIVFATSICFAAPYWLPVQVGTTDQSITTSKTIITDGSIYYKGVTAGDRLDLRNGTSSSAIAFYTFIAPGTNGSESLPVGRKGWVANEGVYFDVTLTGGILGVSLEYSE